MAGDLCGHSGPATVEDTASTRDSQRSRVYRAEKFASYLLYGTYFKSTLSDEAAFLYVENLLRHPDVASRWGSREITLHLDRVIEEAYALGDEITLGYGARNPLVIAHEVAHVIADEPLHSAKFTATYLYLVRVAIGDEAADLLEAAMVTTSVEIDFDALPDPTFLHEEPGPFRSRLPGVTPEEIATTIRVLRAAGEAGALGGKTAQGRQWALRLGTRLAGLLNGTARRPVSVQRWLPETVTVQVDDILASTTDTDLGQALLKQVRKDATTRSPIKSSRRAVGAPAAYPRKKTRVLGTPPLAPEDDD